jgi:hypothetical protein
LDSAISSKTSSICFCVDDLSHSTKDENLIKELQQLLDYCDVQVTLLELYQEICNSRTNACTTHVSDNTERSGQKQKLQDMFNLMENEAAFLWCILEDFSVRHAHQLLTGAKVVDKSQELKAGEFLGSFLLDDSDDIATEKVSLDTKSEFYSAVIGTFLIMPCLSGQYSFTDLCMQLKSACVKHQDIMVGVVVLAIVSRFLFSVLVGLLLFRSCFLLVCYRYQFLITLILRSYSNSVQVYEKYQQCIYHWSMIMINLLCLVTGGQLGL